MQYIASIIMNTKHDHVALQEANDGCAPVGGDLPFRRHGGASGRPADRAAVLFGFVAAHVRLFGGIHLWSGDIAPFVCIDTLTSAKWIVPPRHAVRRATRRRDCILPPNLSATCTREFAD